MQDPDLSAGSAELLEELWLQVFGCLDAKEAAQAGTVCKAWARFATQAPNACFIMNYGRNYLVSLILHKRETMLQCSGGDQHDQHKYVCIYLSFIASFTLVSRG